MPGRGRNRNTPLHPGWSALVDPSKVSHGGPEHGHSRCDGWRRWCPLLGLRYDEQRGALLVESSQPPTAIPVCVCVCGSEV